MTIQDLKEYELLEAIDLKDINSKGYILKHIKSGARISVISNDDDNKVFSIGFKTTPMNETGVPHIIEHTTLCGSKKFPVKDPFMELVKGSLNTFLNAITYPDKTVYPVASCNDQDFKNVMDVYMDAVFNPNITKYEEIFKQEGWHYELENEEDPITINGVVYNEMKGAYSSAEEVLQNTVYKALFPDNTYGHDSGGNPENIPELTYQDYLAFYHKYYHPSNSYIYLYGDMDVVERLIWLDKEYLNQYDNEKVDASIVPQKAFDKAVEVTSDYSVTEEEDTENKTFLSYCRVVGDSLDKMLYQAFDVLDYALVSSPGAPVRQALIDAGVGEDVYGSYDGGIMQPVFSIVAKNANASDKDKFVSIIEDTLKKQISQGIDKKSLLAGINSLEFKFREADFGQFPKGLLYGLQCMDSWLFDDMKPFIHLQCLDTFAKLKELIDTNYFEDIVQKYILDNGHGVVAVVEPNPGKNTRQEEALRAKLAKKKADMSPEEIKALIEATRALKKYQEEPSTEEELLSIPMLGREDIRKEATPFINEESSIDGIKTVFHDINTNGIDYFSLFFNMEDIKEEDLGYVGLLQSVLGYINTKDYSFVDLSNEINIYTGGINNCVTFHSDKRQNYKLLVNFEIRSKVIGDNLPHAISFLDEIILNSDFTDVKRINEIISQIKSRLQINLSSAGNSVASMRSRASFSKYAYYQDCINGIRFYRFICQLEKQIKSQPEMVIEKLKQLTKTIFTRNRLIISFTSDSASFDKAKVQLGEFFSKLPEGQKSGEPIEINLAKCNEGFCDSSQIQYVARTGNFVKEGFEFKGTLRLLRSILSTDYLWNNVRVLGGAYGCSCGFMRDGESYFVSYRDPNVKKTNDVYDKMPSYIRSFNPDERDMTKYIIGTFSSIDIPFNAEAKGFRSMSAYLEGISYEQIQRERDEILNASASDIRQLADLIEAVLKQNYLCVLGNENNIKAASDMFDSIEKLI